MSLNGVDIIILIFLIVTLVWFYRSFLINTVLMAGKKRKCTKTDVYKLQLNNFVKIYDTVSKAGPEPRSGHRIVCNDKALYAVGGYNPTHQVITSENNQELTEMLFHEVWRFDFFTRTWSKLETENMPKELASCATVLSGSLLFLYGGTSIPFGTVINEDVFTCNLYSASSKLAFNKIDIENEKSKPPKQYGQSIAMDGSYLYTVGGTDGFAYSMDVYRLDMRTKNWEKLCDRLSDVSNPSPRYRHEIVYYQDYLYVLGGGTSNNVFTLIDIPAFNLKKRRWEILSTNGDKSVQYEFPANRRCHGCIQNPHNKAVVFINGGYDDSRAYNDTWKLDLNTLQWTLIRTLTLPYGTYFHSTAVSPFGKMIVFGGIRNERHPSERTSDVFEAWITVPKLKEACYEAILYYVRNGVMELPDILKKPWLPLEYKSRLNNSSVR